MSNPSTSAELSAAQLALIEKLSQACGVSGGEGEVRKLVLDEITPVCDTVQVDSLGNVLAVHAARQPGVLKVMVTAHMDEVGLMLVSDEDGGYYRAEAVGSIEPAWLAGKSVQIGRAHIPAVIGAAPHHLIKEAEESQIIEVENMRIDLGPGGAGKAKVGERVAFTTRFQALGPSLRGKALDGRLGVALLIELLRCPPDNLEIQAAFTVQREIGCRGAGVAAYHLNPDVAVVIDSIPAADLPAWDGSENTTYMACLGAGPAIAIIDGRTMKTLSHPRLIKWMLASAEEEGIPYQIGQPQQYAGDAAVIQRKRAGIATLSIAIPVRYAHTPAVMARSADWVNTLRLMRAALSRLDRFILTDAL
jgi:tetrahedral aminopeptidase